MARQPSDGVSLRAEIDAMKAEIRRLKDRSPFYGTGARPNGQNGLQVDGDLIIGGNLRLNGRGTVSGTWQSAAFDGDLNTDDPGDTGWAQDDDKIIAPRLILRPGSVENDALANPVVQTVARATNDGFGLTTSYVERAGVNVTIPSGCTQVQAVVIARLYAVNQNTTGGAEGLGTDAIYVKCALSSQSSTATPTGISGSYGFATTNNSDAFTITGLTPGNTIRLAAQVKCNYQPIAAYADNYVSVVAALTWLR